MANKRILFRYYTLLFFICISTGITSQTIYRVSPNGTGDGSSWANTTTLVNALNKAKAGDQIWVKGFEQITSADQLYITPDVGGFRLNSGVQLYGGFKGEDETETVDSREILEKPYQLKYRSVLSGDMGMNDVVDNSNLIFPENGTRLDNASHVMSVNMAPSSGNNINRTITVINGLSIGGGNADGEGEKGGGIYIYGDNTIGGSFRIERCFLINNYATQGGAIYVDGSALSNGTSLVNQCVVYNNAAGKRAGIENAGGGIYIAGVATVVNSSIFNNENGGVRLSGDAKVVNSTVARNTSGGIDMLNTASPGKYNVINSIIWGNSTLFAQYKPNFKNSAFHEVEAGDTDGNVYVTKENRGSTTSPMFDAPSLKTSYDRDFNWRETAYPLWSWNVLEGSVMLGKGDMQFYDRSVYGDKDMAGNPRYSGSTIDIGAYEFQPIADGRIRYVKPTATGKGDGSSWENASGNLQNMIDELAQNNPQKLPGEVWVAAGVYVPKVQVISGTTYSASFLMRDGISVYGGFAGTEVSKQERIAGDSSMPWDFANETVLEGTYYESDKTVWSESGHKWTLTSDSRHVVFFAPLPSEGKTGFDKATTLNGVTIRGGYAQGGTGISEFLTDCGAGVYMGVNTILEKCIVTENAATGNGGGVYLYGGRILNSLVYNNNADGDGGAVYVDNAGIVLASMLTNNSANNGAAVYLAHKGNWTDGKQHPEYLILSTSVISNNTSRLNGAVYCAKGGVLLQNTITNNDCPTATDNTSSNASQTGGLYVDTYGLVINSVIWNNTIQKRNVPMYAMNPSIANVRFFNTALSGLNNTVWNNVLQQDMIALAENNNIVEEGVLSPDFTPDGIPSTTGVNGSWRDISYFWKPVVGANLRARGMTLGTFPGEVVVAPEIDIIGERFAQKPAIGAYAVTAYAINPDATDPDALKVYVDMDCAVATHDGSSWANAYRSLNEAIAHLASLSKETVGNKRLEIYVLEGDIWPRYAFTNLDPKTATINIPVTASGSPLYIYGGYHRTEDGISVVRDPLIYRSIIDGNHQKKEIEDGLYHCITVAQGANVLLDGFHIINGYAASEASRQYGAGLLVHDNATVTLNNCILENNTAVEGAAIDARNATLAMNNCVVNNNTNTTETEAVINCPNLTMNHVTVANNNGAAPADMGTSSFSVGNTQGTNSANLKSVGADGAKNFANPTNVQGATLGFDTYLGGYSEFRPLTSSADAAVLINKATGTPVQVTSDIADKERNLGGAPDLGAYEAILPSAGKVIYVRSYNTDPISEETEGDPDFTLLRSNPNNIVYDGYTWDSAINGNAVCDLEKERGSNDFYVTDGNGYLIRASIERNDYSTSGSTYGPKSNFYSGFWDYNSKNTSGSNRNNITNNRDERYVSGLQYAVEKAREANANLSAGEEPVVVWVGAGIYTDYKGFVIRDGVKVYGGFPKAGNPGEGDRKPLFSSYIPKNVNDGDFDSNDYETVLQIRKETPVTWTGNSPTISSYINNISGTERRYVLYQPDVCLPTWAVENNYTGYKGANSYRYPGSNSGYIDNNNYKEYTKGALWDGFTVRHGYIKNYAANRDGGAGIRTFRGVTMQNMVIVNNYCHGSRSRGSGLYMDGLNSTIFNSFLLNNMVDGAEAYGGGAYMIVGTGYNMAVANNYAKVAGGGLFIESSTFYNNTVAYNRADGNVKGVGNGSGIFQYADGNARISNLLLYNCIFYGNVGSGKNTNYQITSNTTTTFNNAHNCYVAGSYYSGLSDKFKSSDGNQTGNLDNPFESGNTAQSENNYRLASGSSCVNKGTETIAGVTLPLTDMDYTDRIKDCAIDIGAYERSNQDNVKPDGKGYYYVTQNGAGNASGDSPANAACAMKLQEVLNAAGERVQTNQTATVKIAGYEGGTFVYHANTLSNADDPQSYTYVVPEGITVEGGYTEDFNTRNPKQYNTILSAVKEATTSTQEVNGYHVITFKPATVTSTPTGQDALTKTTIIDGLYLIDGSATSMAGTGNPKTRGGGAIVPSGAHVRNCVIARCEAIQGGGLYIMPGGIVSGSLIIENTAEEGAGGFADNANVSAANRAHMVSCTVTDNTASVIGGGLFMKDGAIMVTNSVLWGNTAPSDKNISGVLTETLNDDVWAKVEPGISSFYPVNNSFVETYEMPSNFENTIMESNEELYFASSSRLLKAYSPLIKHGMDAAYQNSLVKELNVSTVDMQGVLRVQDGSSRVDGGAYAFNGGTIPTDILLTRIFVSQGANVQLSEKDIDNYIGRSFYTSLTWLDDALEYIKTVRANNTEYEKVKFEILLAGGTYKPSYRRADASTGIIDQRQNSYVIPQGVSIYGGFSGTEMITSKPEGEEDIVNIPGVNGDFVCMGEINSILSKRDYSDFNQNGINEPWELAHQVILSGNVNVSDQVKNVYHVVYSDAANNQTTVNPIVLDGLTVMDGETSNVLSNVAEKDEIGRGGGIYSNGISYILNKCRLIRNFAVRGGAVYIRDAKLKIVNSILAGNGTVDNPLPEVSSQSPRGGAVYVAGVDGNPNIFAGLYAINTLWVNNETTGQGGAIGTNYADGLVGTAYVPEISLMNNTFVRNKAKNNPVIYHHNGKNIITNTLMWGNVGLNIPQTDATNTVITYSASDKQDLPGEGNVKLSEDNTSITGPRFARPSTVAGVAGNDANSQWNPAAISVLTDAGNGEESIDGTSITGAYDTWWTGDLSIYKNMYMTNSDYTDYRRYAGPLKADGTPDVKPIDIGVYEYQYELAFPKMDTIYVSTVESGKADGTNWANATSDIRGALVAMANPTGGHSKNKAVYIKAGEYSWPRVSAGTAFTVSMGPTEYGESLNIKGSYNESGIQDFSQPTVITTQETNAAETSLLMDVAANNKPMFIEGLTFINKNPDGGTGMQVSSETGGKVLLKNVGFRGNKVDGLKIAPGTGGEFLFVNTLFADGGTGLNGADNRTTVVNATFANNATADMRGTAKGIYNSVSWNNTTQNLDTQTGGNNVPIDSDIDNDDVNNGPNFRDPNNADVYSRDYRIRPSVKLLNKGNKDNYVGLVGISSFDDETDLGNNARLVDTDIDVGAYEYEAPLQPIVYVKADLTGTADGKSWETALADLQGAVDLAGLYAMNHSADGANGYVFVHGNYNGTENLNITLGNTKIYGSMNDERSNNSLGDSYTKTEVEAIVSELLGKRKGVLESSARSSLTNVNIGTDAVGAVVDGFTVTGAATISNGALSTSIVENNVTGTADGLLYNSLVLGDGTADHTGSVSGVKTVNVTATGAINGDGGSGNNRYGVTETNAYVTDDYWKYQLMETATDDIDKGVDATTQPCIDLVGHSRDLIGNLRIRNTVDNGCFETWNICEGMTSGNVITVDDYPVGKSVVYVRKNQELKIKNSDDGTLVYKDAASSFTPGFLLLEHKAGLRGNRNHIRLTNFAVERDIPTGGADLVAMPFDVDAANSVMGGIIPKLYSGSKRAAYDYKFDDSDGSAWTETSVGQAGLYEGLLFENNTGQDRTLRFNGKNSAPYIENGEDKTVLLEKYNYNDAWSTGNTGTGNRFTHKENMSWNLFGSPYLCAMNYSDMEYGRVVYGYDANGYKTVNTATTASGYIPAGSAVFTQTATLKESEIFSVAQPVGDKVGEEFEGLSQLNIGLSYSAGTRSGGADVMADVLQLNTVEPSEAKTDFDIAVDGVKWMAAAGSAPQIYAERGSGRYSLLSAVSNSGKVDVGVTLPVAGSYTIGLPADFSVEDFEAVVLHDAVTGRSTDLLADSYDFIAAAPGDITGRFTVSFRNTAADNSTDDIKVWSPAPATVAVSGVADGDLVRVYSASGVLVAQAVASSSTLRLSANVSGVAVVDVIRDDHSIKVAKTSVRVKR